MTQSNRRPQTDFADAVQTDEVENQQNESDDIVETPGTDEDGIPYCRTHHCRMRRSSGGKKIYNKTYYRCPVDGCETKAQLIRTKKESVVPMNPVTCQRCSTPDNPVVCVRRDRYSTAASVIVQCPRCEWKSNAMATPNFASQHHQSRYHDQGIGDR